MFNKLLEKSELRYVFTDKRKNYYLQQGGSLANIFKAILPYAKDFAKKNYTSFRGCYYKYFSFSSC